MPIVGHLNNNALYAPSAQMISCYYLNVSLAYSKDTETNGEIQPQITVDLLKIRA